MKRLLISFFVCSMLLTTAVAQTQKGVTYRYNGKQKRTPLGQVSISYDGNKRTVLSDAKDGTFTLVLDGRKMGDRIGLVTVKKREMMVFNQHAVDEWSVRKEPLMLILCNADEFERQKENLIAIGKRQAKKKYDQQKAELEEQLNESKINQKYYEARLDSAYEVLERMQREIEKYADELARLDRSELDSKMQEIVEQYEQGDAEGAVKKLKSLNLLGEFDQRTQHREEIQQELQGVNQDLSTLVERMRQAVPLLKNVGEWNEVDNYLKRIADETNEVTDIWEYSKLCMNESRYQTAETYIRRILDNLKSNANNLDEKQALIKAACHYGIGCIYTINLRYEEGEKVLKSSLSDFQKLTKNYNQDLILIEGRILSLLAFLYKNLNRFDEAEKMYKAVLELDQKALNSGVKTRLTIEGFESQTIMMTKVALADLYYKTNRLDEAKRMCQEALSDQEQSGENGEDAQNSQSIAFGILRNIFKRQQNLVEAERYGRESLQNYRKLYSIHPLAYESAWIGSLNKLAEILICNKKYSESEKLLLEALPVARRRVSENFYDAPSNLANVLNSVGKLYFEQERYTDSEKVFKEALGINEKLSIERDENFQLDVVNDCDYLAMLYGQQQLWSEAEIMLQKAIGLQERFAEKSMDLYGAFLSNLYYRLGFVYGSMNNWNKSIDAYQKTLTIRCIFEKKDFNSYAPYVAQTQELLSHSYMMIKNWNQAEKYLVEALQRYSKLPQQSALYLPRVASVKGLLSFLNIISKHYVHAEQCAREAMSIDSTQHWIQGNLAAALLFQGKYGEAEVIYRQYKDELKDGFLDDFNQFAEAGVIPKEREADVEKIKKLLEE